MLQPLSIPNAYFYARALSGQPLVSNSFFLVSDGGNVLIDPLPLDESTQAAMEERGGVSQVIVLTADREAAAQETATRYGATIVTTLGHRERFASGLIAVRLLHQRREEEFALSMPDVRTIIVGDSLLGTPAGALSMPPDGEYPDVVRAALGLRRILRENAETMLVSQGQSLFANAYETLYRLLYAKAGAVIHKINVDELDFRNGRDEHSEQPSQFQCFDAEVGFAIGARKLGYRVSMLEPGHRFCPLHSHAHEEELFFVIDGEPSVRMSSGTIHCRKGDFIALPVGETGTHQLVNESAAPATVLLLAQTEDVEACYYPDSDKLLVGAPTPLAAGRPSILVRASPELDYFEGEDIR